MTNHHHRSPVPPSQRPALSVGVGTGWLSAVLRVDQIRHDTLNALGKAWAEKGGDTDISNALDDLATAHTNGYDVYDIDALTERVEEAGGMGDAEVTLSLTDARRMRDELDRAIAVLERRPGSVPATNTRRGEAA